MFDLTKEIKLEPRWQKIYRWFRFLVYAAFILSFLYLGYVFLFPSRYFLFSFSSPSSLRNNILEPRNSSNDSLENGEIKKEEILIFDAILPPSEGNFSRIKVDIDLKKDSALIQKNELIVVKSYQSFFYPLGDPVGFKDGDLVKNKGNYYLVSQGKLRKFSASQAMKNLGFSLDNFEEVGKEELKYNPAGDNITDPKNYPDDILIKIEGNYYKFKDNKLHSFINSNAYLSQYFDYQAINRDGDFLNKYELAEEKLGFSSGALLSYGESAFIVSNNEILPIDSPATFESMGFNWDDITPASSEEIGNYERGKLFTDKRSHPDGTIFAGKESGKYYLVQDGAKREIIGSNILRSYLKKNPVLVDEKGLNTKVDCQLKKNSSFFGKSYGCFISINGLSKMVGNDYRFEVTFSSDIQARELNLTFQKTVNWNNLKLSLIDIEQRIVSRYYGQPK